MFPVFTYNGQEHPSIPLTRDVASKTKIIIAVSSTTLFQDGVFPIQHNPSVRKEKQNIEVSLGPCIFVRDNDNALLFQTKENFTDMVDSIWLCEDQLIFMDHLVLKNAVQIIHKSSLRDLLPYEDILFHRLFDCQVLKRQSTTTTTIVEEEEEEEDAEVGGRLNGII